MEDLLVGMDDAERLREQLRARLDECWRRLDDVASELIELHQVPLQDIIDRVVQVDVAKSDDVDADDDVDAGEASTGPS